jgi:photosystem II stability/assembly factor-like uncharacterized protein
VSAQAHGTLRRRRAHGRPGWPRLASSLPLAALVCMSLGAPAAQTSSFQDPLDTPAVATRFAASVQLGAVARAGSRLVAVGARGLIVLSDDEGRTWRQVGSPVSSDLVAVRFVSARKGWASGHDGVILASDDGGEHWVKQLDARMAETLLKNHFAALAAAGDPDAARLAKEVARNYQDGPEVPILGLWFDNEQVGWATGSFGTLLGTRDGGKTWESWIEKVDDGKMLHYNAVRDVGGDVYLASEQGLLYRLDRSRGRFTPVQTGYTGSFFGVVGTRDYVIAYGIGGSAYRSRDHGASWQRIATGVHGGITGACVLDDGRLLLVSQDGRLMMSQDQGDTFHSVTVARPGLFTDVAPAGGGEVVVTGLGGAQRANLQ